MVKSAFVSVIGRIDLMSYDILCFHFITITRSEPQPSLLHSSKHNMVFYRRHILDSKIHGNVGPIFYHSRPEALLVRRIERCKKAGEVTNIVDETMVNTNGSNTVATVKETLHRKIAYDHALECHTRKRWGKKNNFRYTRYVPLGDFVYIIKWSRDLQIDVRDVGGREHSEGRGYARDH